MTANVTLLGTFGAGVLSFVSPCVLPLVPPYLAFIAGASLDELAGVGFDAARRRIFASALAFVAGFSTVFVALGASASVFGQLIHRHFETLSLVAGFAVIVMGLHFLGLFRIPLLYREARVTVTRRPAGPIGAYGIGLAFGFGWTPCIGPVLAAILGIAAGRDTVGEGAGLLAVYAAGLGVPFLVAAAFSQPFMVMMRRFRAHMGRVEQVTGGLLVLTGVAFLTDGFQRVSFWLIETFPILSDIG
ncbi:cytochrome c biogenesis protein CcdA [Siculibacillus lacustris]|uniref:Cytochrome c biogenesis protein CcdA n=1 Tax=Siculibacillus lacustris TaxID=1549641 RepID=A0A4Q9VP47_9HYPH|nr:cytochrome c biogenesis protein CcdA [Siculibacillus lacustris]TBW36967.1 cytochrome c biogenesis protein CcdA [Siculibacillus lacustris]